MSYYDHDDNNKKAIKVRAIRLRNDNKTYLSIDDTDSYSRNLLANENVGKEIRVYQALDRKWHAAAIVDCEQAQGNVYHKVVYSDGKTSWINLKVEKVLIDDDGSLKTSSSPTSQQYNNINNNNSSSSSKKRKNENNSDARDNNGGSNKRKKSSSPRNESMYLFPNSSIKKMRCSGEIIEPKELKEAVDYFGGYDEVVDNRDWQKVRERLGYRFVSSAGYQLRSAY